jgi:peptide/nickel transport system substrate-binding protein
MKTMEPALWPAVLFSAPQRRRGTNVFSQSKAGQAAWKAAIAVLAGSSLLLAACSKQADTAQAGASAGPVEGGTLVYLEQQAHTNLYPPAGGFYPNGGVLNQITDKLTYQDPKTLEIQPWIAESWTVNADATEYSFKLRPGVTFSEARRWTRPPWRATSTPTAWATRR